MAGLAETCSHVAAILYWLETAVRLHQDKACTSLPNSWLPPSLLAASHGIPYMTMEEIELSAKQQTTDSNEKQSRPASANCNLPKRN